MRALFLVALLLAAPTAAFAKDGAGKCLWQTVPQLARDEVILTYGREGREAFMQGLGKLSSYFTGDALAACIGAEPDEASLKGISEAFTHYGLETAAAETLARRAGRTMNAVQALWPGLTAEQRERFRKIARGDEELQMDSVRAINDAARSLGVAPETKFLGDERFEDMLTLFYATATRETAEAGF